MSQLSCASLWLKRNGVRWDGLQIENSTGTLRGTCVKTLEERKREELLASIPKKTVLSVRTASCADLLTQLMEEGLEQSAALNYAVAHEMTLGAASNWYGYLSSLPAFEPLPTMWDRIELSWLAGTGIDVQAKRRKSELREEHAEICRALVLLDMEPSVPFQHYLNASTLTSSRAFFVDEWHGEALVPFADLLNHKCALIPDDAAVEGLSESDEEDEEEQEHDVTGRVTDPKRRDAAQRAAKVMCLDLRMDTTLHNAEGRLEEEDSNVDDGDGETADGAGHENRGVHGHVALIAMRDLKAGQEVFNTYGELDNRALLSNYGFTLPCNPLDVAVLPWNSIESALSHAMSARALRARQTQLRSSPCAARYNKLVRDHEFSYDGSPPPQLLLLLWMLLADPADAPSWMSGPSENNDAEDAEDVDSGAEAMQRFLECSSNDQLRPPTPVVSPMAGVVLAAVEHQRTVLATPLRKARHIKFKHGSASERVDEPHSVSVCEERAARACTVLEGDLGIWERTLNLLGGCGGSPATQAAGGSGSGSGSDHGQRRNKRKRGR